MKLIIILTLLVSTALTISLPKLLGDNKVGTVSFELIDYSRIDPFAPTKQYRDLMVSVFYPIQHVRRYKLAPDFPSLYAAYVDESFGLPPGTSANLTTHAYESAYLHPKSGSKTPNIILFSPGYGGSRLDYTAAMTNLASNGYIVIGVDHPFDTAFIEYPDGRTAIATANLLATPESSVSAVNVRAADLSFVLNALSQNATLAKQIPGVHGKLDVATVGVFGHSLGGATAASSILADSRFVCGANMDGTFWGSVVNTGVSKPFLLFNTEIHNRTSDASWTTFWEKSTGWKLELTVKGSVHLTFSDEAALYEILVADGVIPNEGELFGSLGGERMLAIENAYFKAFFEMCFKETKAKLLDAPSRDFPEVVFWPSG